MNTRTSILSTIVLFGLSAAASPLYSTTLEYSSRATWLSAVTTVTMTTFEGIGTVGNATNYPAATGLTLNGVTFTQSHISNGSTIMDSLSTVLANASEPYWDWGTGEILYGALYSGTLARLHVSLPNAVTAWGVDLMTGSTNGGTYSIQVNGGACTTACSAPTFARGLTPAFFGMTSNVAFTSVDLYFPSNAYPIIDNFSFASASAQAPPPAETPEVGTILLCASGLITLARAKKLRPLFTTTA